MKPYQALIIVTVLLAAVITGGWMLKDALLPAKTVTTQIDSAGNIISKRFK